MDSDAKPDSNSSDLNSLPNSNSCEGGNFYRSENAGGDFLEDGRREDWGDREDDGRSVGVSAVERLREIVRRGESEDKILSPWWVAVIIVLELMSVFSLFIYNLKYLRTPPLGYFIGKEVSIHSSVKASGLGVYADMRSLHYVYYAIAGIFGIILIIVLIYVYVNLISRRNRHFERTRDLYETLADCLEEKGKGELAWKVREIARRCEIETGKRNVAGWVVLSLLPVVNVFAKPYMFHFLTRDYFVHERYEEMIVSCLSRSFGKLQLVKFEYPDRDTVMYYLFSLVTFGIFWIYWMYTLFADPNKHFKEHRMFEELLLEELSF